MSEKRAGLAYILRIICDHCKEPNNIRTYEVQTEIDQQGPKWSKLNERCVLGTIHSGNGHAQLKNLFAPMDVKCMSSKTYKSIERRVGPQIEKVARTSCSNWLEQEVKSTAGNHNLAISYDMGWQKGEMLETQGRGKAQLSDELTAKSSTMKQGTHHVKNVKVRYVRESNQIVTTFE